MKLIKIIDRMFDILNSRNPFSRNYKAPLTTANFRTTEVFLKNSENFITSLKTPKGELVVKSKSFTGFVGFIFCSQSLLAIGSSLLSTNDRPHSYVLSYNFSQDRLELFFNAIRGSLGWNNNPSSRQFQFIYRRFLAHAGVVSDSSGNCIDFTDECTPSDPLVVDVCDEPPPFNPTSLFVDNIVAYISGFVVRKLLKHTVCPDCRLLLIEDPKLVSSLDRTFINLKNNGGLISPSPDFVAIIKSAECFFRSAPLKEKTHNHLTPKVMISIMDSRFARKPHFASSEHLISLIRSAVIAYCKLRAFHLSKSSNLSGKNFLRPRLTKQIHFLSQ